MRKAHPYERAEKISRANVIGARVGEEGENYTMNMETTDFKGGIS